jgi:gamma-glutamylcysteine synthetase
MSAIPVESDDANQSGTGYGFQPSTPQATSPDDMMKRFAMMRKLFSQQGNSGMQPMQSSGGIGGGLSSGIGTGLDLGAILRGK